MNSAHCIARPPGIVAAGLTGLLLFFFAHPACAAQNSPGAITLPADGFAIVLAADAPESLRIAVEALRRDCGRVLGFTPAVLPLLPASPAQTVLVVVNRAGGVPPDIAPHLKPIDDVESHRVYADPEANRIYLDGFDPRGAIYAIYTFSETILGVPPLHHWSSWSPARTGSIAFARDRDLFFRSPQVRFRCILPGDTDFFSPWLKRSPDNESIWLETVLRLKLNQVEGYSTIQPGYQLTPSARQIARHGLALTSHHISGLNTSFSTWEAYWRQVRNLEPPALLLANEPALREFFRYNAETVKRSRIENLWTLAFRGARDEPFWNIFADAPKDDAARAAVINRMLQIQLDTIIEVTGDSAPHVRITFYDEMADLMAKGLLKPPVTPNMIWTYVAARRDPYPYDDLVRHVPRPDVKLGYYMNFGFASTGPHVAPAEGPWKMEFNYRYVMSRSPIAFSVVNSGCFREFVLELSAHAKMLWDFSAYDSDRFLLDYCAQYFGPDHAADIAELYRGYYRAFWQPKAPEFPGLERQFLFQDLRYARAFDHIVRVFFKSPGTPDLNPLRDIGFERMPGRSFRIDLSHNQSPNQIEALLAGLRASIPRFETVAARCTEIQPQLPAAGRRFFNDNLRVYSLYMAHLGRWLEHVALAYRDQADRAALLAHLDRAHAELSQAQAHLFEAQHGIFAEWYSGAEAMTRTFEIEKTKEMLRTLQATARQLP